MIKRYKLSIAASVLYWRQNVTLVKAETQSSRTARSGCGCLFKCMEVYATVCAIEISSRIVQLLRPPLNALE